MYLSGWIYFKKQQTQLSVLHARFLFANNCNKLPLRSWSFTNKNEGWETICKWKFSSENITGLQFKKKQLKNPETRKGQYHIRSSKFHIWIFNTFFQSIARKFIKIRGRRNTRNLFTLAVKTWPHPILTELSRLLGIIPVLKLASVANAKANWPVPLLSTSLMREAIKKERQTKEASLPFVLDKEIKESIFASLRK